MYDINTILDKANESMQKTLSGLDNALVKIRTGRAHPSIVEHLIVDYYGNETPISQVATITVENAKTLKIAPWEKSMLEVIAKSILGSSLGLTPNVHDSVIRLILPDLSKERRVELGKQVQTEGEKFRISIRNARKEANNNAKKLFLDKLISEDELYSIKEKVQHLTDEYIVAVDKKITQKQTKLQEI